MRTIRRLYVYLVAFISLEVVTWGLIGLVRSMGGGELIGSGVSQLASAISLILVGVPVFLLHWWLAQRSIVDNEEHFARLRAIFLYGALLATLIPMVQNFLAILDRTWLKVFNLPMRMALIGEGQSFFDNLIAIMVNGLIMAYIYMVLQKDWAAVPQGMTPHGENLAQTRRLYRYIWMIYGLGMVVGGVQQVLYYLLNLAETIGEGPGASLANGLSLVIVGLPLWVFTWRNIQGSLIDPDERRSTLRLIILYALSLIGVGGVLIPAGLVFDVVFRGLLGETLGFNRFLTNISAQLAAAIPFGGVWAYFGRTLTAEVEALPDTPKRAGLRRFYFYILSFVGLVATFLGLHALLSYVVDTLFQTTSWADTLRSRLSAALATLTIGLPLWLVTWRAMIKDASQDGEPGDHARRSLVRKVYLFLVIFAGVIGVMVSAGSLIYQFLSKLLGDPPDNFERASWLLVEILILFTLLLVYHWATLRSDGRLAESSLVARHEAFPVLILTSEIGDYSKEMVNALKHEVSSLPVVVYMIDNGVPDEMLSEAKVVILPGELATNPPEAIRLWLLGYSGIRLVVPTPFEGWLWTFGSGRHLSELTRQTAKIISYLAEGEEIPKIRETSSWMVVVYILAGIFGIPIIFLILSLLSEILY